MLKLNDIPSALFKNFTIYGKGLSKICNLNNPIHVVEFDVKNEFYNHNSPSIFVLWLQMYHGIILFYIFDPLWLHNDTNKRYQAQQDFRKWGI